VHHGARNAHFCQLGSVNWEALILSTGIHGSMDPLIVVVVVVVVVVIVVVVSRRRRR